MCAASMAFIEDSGTAKNAGKQLSTRIFCGSGFYKRQEKKIKREEKKMIFPWRYAKTTTIKSLYIKGNSLNFLLVVCFYLSLTVKNLKDISHRKRR